MAAHRRVYDLRHLQADYKKTGISSGTLRWVIKYGLPLPLPNYSVRLKTVVTLTGVDAVVTGGDLSCAEMMRDL